ncbi:MAG: helix-turn-helix domain-containing protein [Kibdelosporangium sp.]
MPGTPRRQRWDAARNRRQLLDAAKAAFDERGLAADVREIAARAGVGVATLYRHFPTKDDLVQATLGDDLTEWSTGTGQALAAEDAWHGLTMFIEQTLTAMAEHRAILDGISTSADAPAAFEACQAHLREALTGLVNRAHSQGTLRPVVTATDIALQIFALGRIIQLTADHDPAAWRKHSALMLDGLHVQATRRH